jgi:hypothetical protein
VLELNATRTSEVSRSTREDQDRVDAAFRSLISGACAPIGFDRDKLASAVRAFPVMREPQQDVLSGTWGRVPDLEMLPDGRILRTHRVEGGSGLGFREGRSFRVTLGPGVGACSSFDVTRRERAYERGEASKRYGVDEIISHPLFKPYDRGVPSGVIVKWSSKSRARMVRGFASVDWSGLSRCYCGQSMAALCHTFVAVERCSLALAMPLAMVTFTYPNDWLAVAPDGKTAKRQLGVFRQRWGRAMGWRLDGAWKMEFQRPRECGGSCGERAPHFHLLMPVPATVPIRGGRSGPDETFKGWLSRTWADVVGAVGDERVKHEAAGTRVDFRQSAKMSDPKRMAVYFLKHGTKSFDDKEYQHIVPDAWQKPGKGPGRFWGFWGMESATVALDLDMGDWITARRVLRRVAAARARAVKYSRAYGGAVDAGRPSVEAVRDGMASAANQKTPRGIRGPKKLRTLGAGGQLSGGWVVVSDGPALAGALARAVNLRRLVEIDWGNGESLDRSRLWDSVQANERMFAGR